MTATDELTVDYYEWRNIHEYDYVIDQHGRRWTVDEWTSRTVLRSPRKLVKSGPVGEVDKTFTVDFGWNTDPHTYELFFGRKLPEEFHTTPEQKERYMMGHLHAVPGDVVTIAKGEFGKPGYKHEILTVVADCPSEDEITPVLLEDRVFWRGYRITERVKKRPAIPSPLHALAFADDGLFISDGGGGPQWSSADRDFISEDALRNPIEAVAVPAEELRRLFHTIERHNKSMTLETQGDVSSAARKLVEVAQSQHNRSGVKFDA